MELMDAALVAFLTVAGLLSAYLVCRLITSEQGYRKRSNALEFEQAFGFEVPRAGLSLDQIGELQQEVDAELEKLAEAVAKADLAERKVRTAAKEARSGLEKRAHAEKIAQAKGFFEAKWDAFWHAHKLAKWAGFAFRTSYKDYLEDELRTKVEGKGPRPGPPNPIPEPKPLPSLDS